MNSIIICLIYLLIILYFLQLFITICRLFIEDAFETKKEFFTWLIPIFPFVKSLVDKVNNIGKDD